MSIKVGHAKFARGYSGYDHLLDDDGMSAVVGRTFPSPKAAARAAAKAAGHQDRRCAGCPVVILDENGDGGTVWP